MSLPSEYVELEYVTSIHGACIDDASGVGNAVSLRVYTNVRANINKTLLKINNTSVMLNTHNDQIFINSTTSYINDFYLDNWYTIYFENKSNTQNLCIDSGYDAFSTSASITDSGYTVRHIPYDDISGLSLGRITYFKDNFIARDLVPCYRKIDGEVGFYDEISKQFYYNVSTTRESYFEPGPALINLHEQYKYYQLQNSSDKYDVVKMNNEDFKPGFDAPFKYQSVPVSTGGTFTLSNGKHITINAKNSVREYDENVGIEITSTDISNIFLVLFYTAGTDYDQDPHSKWSGMTSSYQGYWDFEATDLYYERNTIKIYDLGNDDYQGASCDEHELYVLGYKPIGVIQIQNDRWVLLPETNMFYGREFTLNNGKKLYISGPYCCMNDSQEVGAFYDINDDYIISYYHDADGNMLQTSVFTYEYFGEVIKQFHPGDYITFYLLDTQDYDHQHVSWEEEYREQDDYLCTLTYCLNVVYEDINESHWELSDDNT